MPEGDTVHKLATRLCGLLAGMRLRGARVRHHPGLRLDHRTVAAVEAAGKHLLITFTDGLCIRTHLGMHGSWHRYAPGETWRRPPWRAVLVLESDRDTVVCFDAMELEVMPSGRAGLKNRIGPDLLGDAPPDPIAVVGRARQRPPDTMMADLLLDQWVASGIGNVYKSESLFLEGLAPERRLDNTSNEALERLYRCAAMLLRRNTGSGPRTTRFQDDGRGRLWVYGRGGRPCLRCGTAIERDNFGRHRRLTYWCSSCQPYQ